MNSVTLTFEYRLLEQSEIYTDDEPTTLNIDKASPEWLSLIDAEFVIYEDGRIFYDEEVFPIAEFVHGLLKWMESGMEDHEPYSYDNSLNFEDQEGVITITREGDGWQLSALWEEIPGGIWVAEDEFERKLRAFVEAVREEILALWGVDVAKIGDPDLVTA